MPQSYESEIKEVAGLAGEAMDAFTTALFLVEEPRMDSLVMVACNSPSNKLIQGASIKMGAGLVGWVAKHGKPASAAFKGEASNLLFYSGQEDIKSFAAAPIFEGDRLTGVLAVDSKSPGIFTDKQIRLLSRFAATLGAMIILEKKQERLAAEAADLKALAQMAESIRHGMSSLDMAKFLKKHLEAAIPHDHLALAVKNLDTGSFDLLGAGPGRQPDGAEPFSITHYRFGWVIHQSRSIYLPEVDAPVLPGDEKRWKSFIGAPIIADGEMYGAVGLMSYKPMAFKRSDVSAVVVAASMAAASLSAPALKEQARVLALTDPVSKTFFYRTLLERRKDMRPSGVVALVDLKGFRHVNKELLPKGGDSVLAQMSDRLKKSLSDSASISRYYGDTFLVILPGMSMGQAQRALGAALDEIELGPFHFGGVDALIIPCAGAAACPEDGASTEELLLKAEEALRAAKREQGQKIVFHCDLQIREISQKSFSG